MAERYQDILIRVRGRDSSGRYPVEIEVDDGSRAQGTLVIDRQALLAAELDPPAYGMALFDALFAGAIGRAYGKALGRAEARTNGRLRVRLWIEPEAAELHALPWERMYHAPRGEPIPLATSALNPFSRYTGLDIRDPHPIPTRPLRLLFALSNPWGLPEGLKPLDIEEEVRVLLDALGDLRRANRIKVTILSGRTPLSPDLQAGLDRAGYDRAEGPTTFEALTGMWSRYEIVHFVGHGTFRRDAEGGEGESFLYLEKSDGTWDGRPDQDLMDRLAPAEPPPPYLVFLSACQSARQETDPTHPFVGLGPKLVRAGVPAVIGMQAAIPAQDNRELVRAFYRTLFEHGLVDLAMNQARLALYDRREVDWATPVLFSRLTAGRLLVPDDLANRVVTPEGVMEETEHGALVTKARETVGPERLPPPVRLLPRTPDLLGRVDELALAASSLGEGHAFEFYGAPGLGKTTVLRFLSNHAPEAAIDGVVYLPRKDRPVDDILQALYEALYTSDGAYKPTPTEILKLLQDIKALVVVDDTDLPREEIQRLVDSVPAAPVLLASTERNLWGEGRATDLKGLPEDVAVALFERELGTPLDEATRPDAATLCRQLDGNPLRIIQAAGRVREEGITVAEACRQVEATPSSASMGAADVRDLTPDERRVLAVLAALDGVAIHPDHLATLTGLPGAGGILERLRTLGLAKAASPRFSLTEPTSAPVDEALGAEAWRGRLLEYFTQWCAGHGDEPGAVLEEVEPILSTLEWARTAHPKDFLRLAQCVEGALIIGRRWGTWRSLLRQELAAAEALGDRSAKARALHQLGTQALGQDAKRGAKTYLKEALAIRKSIGDDEGAKVTRHNLKLLPAFLVPPFVLVTFLVLVVGSLSVVGASIFIGGASGVPPIGLGADPERVDFGQHTLGTATDAAVNITPTGAPATLGSIGFDPPVADYVLNTDCATTIEDGGCLATIVFRPLTVGSLATELVVSYNGANSPLRIPVSGVGVPPVGVPAVSFDPSTADFGEVLVGAAGRLRVVVGNPGDADLLIQDLGLDATEFQIIQQGCAGVRLEPGSGCVVDLAFIPSAPGPVTGTLQVIDNAGGSPHMLTLTGTGVGPWDLVIERFEVGAASIDPETEEVLVPVQFVALNQGSGLAPIFSVSAQYVGPDDPTPFFVFFRAAETDQVLPTGTGLASTRTELAPGTAVTFSGQLVFQSDLRGQQVQVAMVADSCVDQPDAPLECRVSETDETNNISSSLPVLLDIEGIE